MREDMSWKNDVLSILNEAGLQITAMVGGLFGALASLFYERAVSKRRMAAIVLMGAIAAGYLTPLVCHLTNMPEKISNSLAFLVGLMAMKITDALLKGGVWLSKNIGGILKSHIKK